MNNTSSIFADTSDEIINEESQIPIIPLEQKYLIKSKIGEGGMSMVFHAEDLVLKRDVVIKRIKQEIGRDFKFLKRFINEAKAIASFKHPNIVAFYELARDKDGYYIVMEYLQGENLGEFIKKRGKVEVRIALEIIEKIAEALHLAHKKSIWHRDIKPGNIIISEDNTPKILDFGIAKLVTQDENKTSGKVGTFIFMSPEQFNNPEKVDQRTDIYALGKTMYNMLTGNKPPIFNIPIDFDSLKEFPECVIKMVKKMVAENQEKRYYSAEEISNEIKKILADSEDKTASGSQSLANHVENRFFRKKFIIRAAIFFLFILVSAGLTYNFFLSEKNGEPRFIYKRTYKKTPEKLVDSGAIYIESEPPDAEVFIDGDKYGNTPLVIQKQLSGKHELIIKKKDYKLVIKEINVKRDRILKVFYELVKLANFNKMIKDMIYFEGFCYNKEIEPKNFKDNLFQRVCIDPFYLDKSEVTVFEYQLCVRDGICDRPVNLGKKCNYENPDRLNYPVNCITWNMANTYCEWKGKKLPNDDQWQYAAGRKHGFTYPWGNSEPDCDKAIYDQNGQGCGKNDTWPVCSKSPGNSKEGVCDLSGNVFEWGVDWYDETQEKVFSGTSIIQPKSKTDRIILGGSWLSNDDELEISKKFSFDAEKASEVIGFRCSKID